MPPELSTKPKLMKYKTLSISLLASLLVVFLACDRKSRPIAARKDTPKVEQVYSESVAHIPTNAVPSIAGIKEVLPKKVGEIDGAALFKTNCAACHQLNGQGLPGVFPPLANSPYVVSDNKERMASIMLYGLMGPVNVLGTTYNSMMNAVGMTSNATDEELSAIAGYVRSAWGNKADGIGAEVFEAMRKKYGSRGPFSIQELGEEK